MSAIPKSLKRSKSLCSVSDVASNLSDVTVFVKTKDDRRSSSVSDSSVEIVIIDPVNTKASSQTQDVDSCSQQSDGQALHLLEQKIDRLSDMFLEQCRLLTTLKEDIRNSKIAMEKVELAHTDILTEVVKKTVVLSNLKDDGVGDSPVPETNSRAKSLLDAIESRQDSSMDREIREALLSFLQSDELKNNMVAATAESVRGVIGDFLSCNLSSLYLPMIEHSHRRLLRQVRKTIEDAFVELEENSVCLSRSVFKITKSLRRSIERHQNLLEAAADPQRNIMDTLKFSMEELLHSELKQWRQKVVDVLMAVQEETECQLPDTPTGESVPSSPPQPADPDRSIVDHLMMAAVINKQLESGDVNGAFESALTGADLSLVSAACRGAERAGVFHPRCRLHQHVLLALLQQLSTDVLHDTQLKCQYLEESIINLDPNDAVTRVHLPLVIGEVRKHLTKFLTSYPGHFASRRVSLIIMAAENLLK